VLDYLYRAILAHRSGLPAHCGEHLALT
jgi:hypothetical protein